MRFKILTAFLCLLIFAPVISTAAPLYFELVTVTQKDGTTLHLYASGDEFYNWLHDKDGYTIILDSRTGYYVYAELKGDELVPTKLTAGTSNPSSLGLMPWLRHSDSWIQQYKLREYGSRPPAEGDAPKIGTINNLVVFIRFADESEFTDQLSIYSTMFNSNAAGANSMYNYFREVSYDKLYITSHFYPYTAGSIVVSYQDSHVRNYFKPYDANTNPIGYQSSERTAREHTLLMDACNNISSQVPVSLNLDGDNDGRVDNVCFIISGSTTAWATLLWPHRWSLYSYVVNINGKRVYDYNFQLQNSLKSSGVGVLCHEMFHSLGAPDLYHYTSNGISPCYRWDVMDYNANPPEHMGAYMKWKYGNWISSIPVIGPGTYSLKPLTSATNNCYRINSPYSSTEYFVLEYRKKSAPFENSIPDNGLIVYRINTTVTGNANGPPDEVYIYRPGGTLTANGNPSQANFSSLVGRTVMNSTTNPSPFLTDGSQGGLSLMNIGNPDTTISFTFSTSLPPVPTAPTLLSPSNGATDVSLTPLLDWSDMSGTSYYKLQVSDNSSFSGYMINDSSITVSQFTVPSNVLQPNTQYFWRVYAVNAGGSSPSSAVFGFITQSPPPLIQLGIFNDGACLVFKAKSNVSVNNVVTGIIFTFRYLTNYNITFQDPQTLFGFTLANNTTIANYTYRSYSSTLSSPVNWNAEVEYEIMRVSISGGSGSGLFELSNKIKSYSWYIALNGSNHANTADPFYVTSTESPLPVTMASMRLNVKGEKVSMNWETSREINNKGFEVEKLRYPDTSWQVIGFVEGKGNSTTLQKYSFTENNFTAGKYRYRLKQIDYNRNCEIYNFNGDAVIEPPKSFGLSQNYPNPFNPYTSIRYDVPFSSNVKISVFDVTGRLLQTLVNGQREAGAYIVKWDASQNASGIYFYRLEAGNYNQIKRMILIK